MRKLDNLLNVVFRSVAVPSATSDPVEVRVYINPYFVANADYKVLTTTGGLHPSQPGQTYSITQNDKKLLSCGTNS